MSCQNHDKKRTRKAAMWDPTYCSSARTDSAAAFCGFLKETRVDAACRSRAISVDEMKAVLANLVIRGSGPTVPYPTFSPRQNAEPD